ncbi:uncharacterized protein YgbK (DUF1537 family) [Sphingomonas zeicaulis]|uniref:four-carbon acid sugar kinase family protein n=1 Tax=Sphingomonas zeicaulis TaxID=1632740 RepID=UPI003D235015
MARAPIVMIADDLTGALDSAAPFRTAGLSTIVALDVGAIAEALATDADIIVIDSDTRHRAPAEVGARMAGIWAALAVAQPRLVMVKVDSRLKGPIAAMIAALLEHSGRTRALVCPAAPDQYRIVRGGQVTGKGVAAPISVAARLDGPPADIADGEDMQDMRALARRLLAAGNAVLGVGARGMAQGLAAELAVEAGIAPRPAATPLQPLLLVVGSRDPIALAQVEALLDRPGIVDCPAPGGYVGRRLPEAPVMLLRATDDGAVHEPTACAARLARGVAPLVARNRPATLFLSGGDTAHATLRALGIDLLVPEGEVLPGAPICRPPDSDMHIVTKSGGFGAADALVAIVAAASPAQRGVAA